MLGYYIGISGILIVIFYTTAKLHNLVVDIHDYLVEINKSITKSNEYLQVLSLKESNYRCSCVRNQGTTLSCEVHVKYYPGITYR